MTSYYYVILFFKISVIRSPNRNPEMLKIEREKKIENMTQGPKPPADRIFRKIYMSVNISTLKKTKSPGNCDSN